MKQLRYIVLAAALASGAAFSQSIFSQSRHPAGQAGFVLPGQAVDARLQTVTNQALDGLAGMLAGRQALPPGFPLAVASLQELQQARLGWGFAVNDVRPQSLKAGMSLWRAAQATGQWRYALVVHGKPVGLVTLEHGKQGWQVVSFGGAGLSRDIQRVLDRYAGQQHVQFRYVRVPQATSDFIEVRQGKAAARYAPLGAARSSLHQVVSGDRLLSAAELVPSLRAATARNVDAMH